MSRIKKNILIKDINYLCEILFALLDMCGGNLIFSFQY